MDLIAGIVLAAGKSTRMGEPKPLLDAGGRTFLERASHVLAAGGCSPVIVVLHEEEGPAAEVARSAGAAIVCNPHPETGPIGSLRCALDTVPPGVSACIVLPVDHPLVAPDTVTALIARYRETGAPVVVPTHENRRGHPSLFGHAIFHELRHGDLPDGARSVVRAHEEGLVLLPVNDPGILADVDTPADYWRHFPNA